MPVMINAIIPQGRGSYKTLYLLHGMGGDYTTWITKSRAADYVDNTDIAVIMISGDNKCYVDNVHGRKYFTFLTEELIETCTNWFGLSCDRKDRYIAGMSMGDMEQYMLHLLSLMYMARCSHIRDCLI